MKVTISPDSLVKLAPPGNAVKQIEQQIAEKVRAGVLPVGASLPATRALALALNVSSFTIMDAYQRLAASGILLARKKSAYTVLAQSKSVVIAVDVLTQRIKDYAWLLQETTRRSLGHAELSGSNLPPDWEDHRIAQRALKAVATMGESVLHAPVEPLGYLPLREVLQSRLQALGIRCQREQILVTGGATAAIGLLASLLVQPGEAVLVDDPGFFALFGLLHLRGAKVVGVRRLVDGPDLTHLLEMIDKHRPKLFIVQSVLHSPTGSSIRADIAVKLLALAAAQHVKIIECDFYADLASTPHIRLAELAGLDGVVYVGACAKVVTGTARLGYIASSPKLVESIGKLKLLYGSTNPPIHERIAYRALTDPQCARHLGRLRDQLSSSSALAKAQLGAAGFECADPNAEGKYLWVRHRAFTDSTRLAERLDGHQLSLAPGRIFRPEGVSSDWFRINVTSQLSLLTQAISALKSQ